MVKFKKNIMINSCAAYIFARYHLGYLVLVGKRGNSAPTSPGLYNVPVGLCEDNEMPDETITREIYEETGLKISKTQLINDGTESYSNGKIGANYVVILDNPLETSNGDGENDKFIWVNINNIHKLKFAFGMDSTIITMYNKYIKQYINEKKMKKGNLIIKESQLRSIVKSSLLEMMDMNGYVSPEDREYQMNQDWDDIDSYGTSDPTDGSYELGDNPSGRKDLSIDDIYDDADEVNQNIYDNDGYMAMNAMDRGIEEPYDKKCPKANASLGRTARKQNMFGDNTFNDEIDKYNLNIDRDNLDESKLRHIIHNILKEMTDTESSDYQN